MRTWSKKDLIALLLSGALSAMAMPVAAATIVLTEIPGLELDAQQRLALRGAANFWANKIANNIQINVNVGQADLGSNALASAFSRASGVLVQDVYAGLASRVASPLDAVAVANLSPLVPGQLGGTGINGISMVTPDYTGFDSDGVGFGIENSGAVFDDDGSFNNAVIGVNTANQKALGLITDQSIVDGDFLFNSQAKFDLDPTDGISSDAADFIGVAVHELGHLLGFVSGVDDYDRFGGPNGELADAECFAGTLCRDYPVNKTRLGYVLDLFRYSDAFPDARNELVWVPGAPSYFSVDGGTTALGGFSTGVHHGDGWQASHWTYGVTEDAVIGIMDPASFNGELRRISGLDFAAFDAIGYNFNFAFTPQDGDLFTTRDAVVSSPALWSLLLCGIGVAGLFAPRAREAQ